MAWIKKLLTFLDSWYLNITMAPYTPRFHGSIFIIINRFGQVRFFLVRGNENFVFNGPIW